MDFVFALTFDPMISFKKFTLDNGMRLLVHEDPTTPLVAVNLLYQVGSRDEQADKTGFAHLFEHLMFGGSAHAPDFDSPLQNAGGDSNAFTNTDITNYYDVIPSENLETVLWLESDRMASLRINQKTLKVQKQVVIEEFKESHLNIPYGDAWHLLLDLCYKQHPYNWPTIGKKIEHIRDASLEDVREFFKRYYRPNNTILTLAGNITAERALELTKKWFGDIPGGEPVIREIPREPAQAGINRLVVTRDVPADAIFMAFPMADRFHPDYYAADLISDILANGPSCRLHQRLVKKDKIFSHVDAYVTGTIDPGLFMLEGKPNESHTIEQGEEALWHELEDLKKGNISKEELEKVKNKMESAIIFSETNILSIAQNLAFFEYLGDPEWINAETEFYEKVTMDDIVRVSNELFVEDHLNVLAYLRVERDEPATIVAVSELEEEDEDDEPGMMK